MLFARKAKTHMASYDKLNPKRLNKLKKRQKINRHTSKTHMAEKRRKESSNEVF
jgi:ribosomal protein RSM22 (predicted rRNA methylase)